MPKVEWGGRAQWKEKTHGLCGGILLACPPTPNSNLSSGSSVDGLTEHSHGEWLVASGDTHREIKVFSSESRLFFPIPRSKSSKDGGFTPVTALVFPPGHITF